MPIYEYTCDECNHQFETVQKMDTKTTECPKCRGISRRNGFERVSPFVWGKGGSWQ